MTDAPPGPRPHSRSGPDRVQPYDRVKQAIVRGELHPGDPLVETTLAEWCQVSRTPIREALLRLEQDGLVRRSDRGMVVRESSPAEILDLYDTRIVLESRAAAVAAERRTDLDLVAMRRAVDRMRRVDDTDPHAMAERNRELHHAIWRASHNESLIDLLERLYLHLGRFSATTLVYPGRHETSHLEHDELVDAIEARDAERAAAAATKHFTAARDIRLKLWESE